jgi:hypothetical protein
MDSVDSPPTRPDPPVRQILVPDLDRELTAALTRLEEVLITLECWQADGELLPEALDPSRTRDAVRRLWDLLVPTQAAGGLGGRRLLAPDGKYEHLPLHLVDVDQADLDLVGEAVKVLGREVAAGGEVSEAVAAHVRTDAYAHEQPAEVVEEAARLHGLLTLAWTDDTAVLANRIRSAGAGDIVLDAAEEAAYQRVASRLNGMWSLGDGLARFEY